MFHIAALYQFAKIENPESFREELRTLSRANDIQGTFIVAAEGLNGTVAGEEDKLNLILDWIKSQPGFNDIAIKRATSEAPPFKRMKVKVKNEIVTMRKDGADPTDKVGKYVEPENWNELISDPDTILIDTRNSYEYRIGTFKGAIDPGTRTFGQFPEYLEENFDLKELDQKGKKLAMFCTGGIRCERATAYIRNQGFDEVYHLKGGILRYLEEIPEDSSLWEGACFVFDGRVGVTHGLSITDHEICYACGGPVSEAERQLPQYVFGEHCPHCYGIDKSEFCS